MIETKETLKEFIQIQSDEIHRQIKRKRKFKRLFYISLVVNAVLIGLILL